MIIPCISANLFRNILMAQSTFKTQTSRPLYYRGINVIESITLIRQKTPVVWINLDQNLASIKLISSRTNLSNWSKIIIMIRSSRCLKLPRVIAFLSNFHFYSELFMSNFSPINFRQFGPKNLFKVPAVIEFKLNCSTHRLLQRLQRLASIIDSTVRIQNIRQRLILRLFWKDIYPLCIPESACFAYRRGFFGNSVWTVMILLENARKYN